MTLKGIFTRAATTDYFHQFGHKNYVFKCLFTHNTDTQSKREIGQFWHFFVCKKISRLFVALIFTQM